MELGFIKDKPDLRDFQRNEFLNSKEILLQ
jgi:hypothetical protein